MTVHTIDSGESQSGSLKLVALINAEAFLKLELLKMLQPVIDNASDYMPDSKGMVRNTQKKFNISSLYESFGIPANFAERRSSSEAVTKMEMLQ